MASQAAGNRSTLIVQMTDPHIVANARLCLNQIDTSSFLREAIETVRNLTVRPDAVLITGDLAHFHENYQNNGVPGFNYDLARAGKGPSDGWMFFTSYNSEQANTLLEVNASQNDKDYIAAVNYRVTVTTSTLWGVTGVAVIGALNFDMLNDFAPIALLSVSSLWIMGKNDLPAKDLKELVAWMKANPERCTGDAVVISDMKTSRSRWSRDQARDSSEQLLLYSELVKHLVPGKQLRLQFVVLTKSKQLLLRRLINLIEQL